MLFLSSNQVTSIKVGCKGHRNSRSQRLDQATFRGAHRVIDDIWDQFDKEATRGWKQKEEDVEKEKPSDEDDDLALIIRKLNKYMRDERFRGRKFTSRRDPSKKESSSHGDNEKWEKKRDLICFKCKKPGHIKYDCLLYKSEVKRRMKKAMMVTWSESEESSEEEIRKKWQTCASWQWMNLMR